jgi:hypothetical protein
MGWSSDRSTAGGFSTSAAASATSSPISTHTAFVPFTLAGIGLALNFLSGCAPRLDHTYLPNDFTLCMYRMPPWAES